MARHFVAASSQRLTRASSPVTGYPLTMACWVRPTTVSATQTALSLCSSGTNNQHTLAITSGAKLLYEVVTAGVAQDAIGTTNITAGAWHHIAAVGTSATSRQAYRDGVADGSNTTSGTPASIADLEIGNLLATATHTSFFNGDVAEAAVWNVALTQAEITMLSLGVSPLLIRPGALKIYVPMRGGATVEQDFMGATGLTVTGATVIDHPKVWLPRGVHVAAVPTVGGGGSVKSITASGINATSAMTGSVVRRRPVTPAAINATSTMTGNVVRIRPVTGTINATSTVTGTVNAIHRVTPSAITASSTLTGNVVRLRPVTPSSITATSALAATLSKLGNAPLIPSAINATSVVTGTLNARHAITPAAIQSTSPLSGSLAVKRMMSGINITATSTIGGSLTKTGTNTVYVAKSVGSGIAKGIDRTRAK